MSLFFEYQNQGIFNMILLLAFGIHTKNGRFWNAKKKQGIFQYDAFRGRVSSVRQRVAVSDKAFAVTIINGWTHNGWIHNG
jgi:hypothetical protein